MALHKKGHSLELVFEGCYESTEITFLYTLDLRGKIAIDIGSCIGYYSLHLSKLVGTCGKVLSFEPEQRNYELLCKNVELNNITNICTYKMAVGNDNKKALLCKHVSPGQHSIAIKKTKNNTINVSMVCLDDYLNNKKIDYKDICYIKIDTEGYEFNVLKGMEKIIASSKNLVLQMEFAPQHLKCYNFSIKNFISFIKKNGLTVYYWNLKFNKLFQLSDVNWLKNKDVVENFNTGEIFSRNILLTRNILNRNCYAKEILPMEVMAIKNLSKATIYQTSDLMDLEIVINIDNTSIELPRSGTYFVQYLRGIDFRGKKVLDIGTGYFGYLAQHVKYFGAKKVVGVDLNKYAIEYANKHYKKDGIDYKVSNVYSDVDIVDKFDILISNPPQLPSVFGGRVHDVSGNDGLDVIREIIIGFSDHVNENGLLYLLVFDFLFEEIKKLCIQYDLQCNIVAYFNKTIRKGGETEKRKEYIEEIYPTYVFMKDNKKLRQYVFILEIKQL